MCSRFEVTPAKYEDRQIEVTYEAHEKIIETPATYKVVDASREGLPARCPETTFREEYVVLQEDEDQLVLVPTTFKYTKDAHGNRRYVVDESVSVKRVPNDGSPSLITRLVVEHEAQCEPEEMIPAETYTVQQRVVDKPGSVRREFVPKTTKTFREKVLVEPAEYSIRLVPCEDEAGE